MPAHTLLLQVPKDRVLDPAPVAAVCPALHRPQNRRPTSALQRVRAPTVTPVTVTCMRQERVHDKIPT